MPARNSRKQYLADGYYHLYNRGVEKRKIFLDEQDYAVFLSYLKVYLTPKDLEGLHKTISSSETSFRERDKASKLLHLNNFADEIELHAYSLLPNHFHFLVKQNGENSIDHFMNSLGTRYTMYFNRKYRRVGTLYQGVYKAVLVETDEQLLHLSRYIHLNPVNYLALPLKRWGRVDLPSSFPEYLVQRQTSWVKTEQILSYFKKDAPAADYLSFVVGNNTFESIARLAIDFEDET